MAVIVLNTLASEPVILGGTFVAIFLVAAILAAVGTYGLGRVLERRAIVDRPNHRSSHDRPTPRGGGLAIVAVIAVALALDLAVVPGMAYVLLPVLVAFVALAAVSWTDDLRTLPALPRIAAQAAAVAAVMWLTPVWWSGSWLVFQGLLPAWADHALAGLAWLWFINLFNFMDGIDGLAGSETVVIGVGLTGLGLVIGLGDGVAPLAAATAGAAAGFLLHNRPPARIFMGDVGSVPLGFVLGWLLLVAAAQGQWAAALILPGYFLADATITLLRRALRGEKVWQAHREHFYQMAVRRGLSHAQVLAPILLANAGLLVLAFVSIWAPWTALAGTVPVIGLLLARLAGRLGAARAGG